MKRAFFRGVGLPLSIEEIDMPQPVGSQALIRVERCGICGSDLHMTSGSVWDFPIGTVMGHEYSGEIVELGSEPGAFKVGDRVTVFPMSPCGQCDACRRDAPIHCPNLQSMTGGYGEYTLIDLRTSLRLPGGMTFEDGALIEPMSSSLRGVRRLKNIKGARIAVIGGGAIGASAIYWARKYGAGPIACIARSRKGENIAAGVGADGFATIGEDLAGDVSRILGGAPEIIIETAGAPGTMQLALDLTPVDGTILSLGGCTSPDPILPAMAMHKECTIQFSVAYGVRDFRETVETFGGGGFEARAMIGDTISLTDLPERFEHMRTHSHPAKVMVRPNPPAG